MSSSTLIDSLKFTFMGFFEVRKGRWGGLVDFMYLNVGGSESQTRSLSVLGHPLPVGVTANLDTDIKGSIVTLGGSTPPSQSPPCR